MPLAAAISYYALFAIFPLAILGVAGFSLVLGEQTAREDVLAFLVRQLPVTEQAGRRDLDDLLRGVTRDAGTFGAVGLAGLIFSASGLMGAVRHGLNTAWDIDERRPPLQGKLIDLLLVLGLAPVIALSLTLTVGTRVARDVRDDLPGLLGEASGPLGLLVAGGARLLPVLMAFLVFFILYRFVPATAVRARDAALGALVAALGHELVKQGFGVYLAHFADYGAVYGSLGTAVAFAFFVFVSANVFLLGAEVAAHWWEVRSGHDDAPGEPDPRSRRRRLLDAARGLVIRDERRDG